MRLCEQGGLMFEIIFCRRFFATISIVVLLSAGASRAQKPEVVPPTRPRIGLVLEGGGALGFAHVGVIEWMEDHHIRSTMWPEPVWVG